MKGATEIVSGTIAAAVPIDEPTMRRVKGMIATSRIMKGTERRALTTAPSTALRIGIGRKDFLSVTKSTMPSGMPRTVPMPPEMNTITSVSRNESKIMLTILLDIGELLYVNASLAQEFDGFGINSRRGFDKQG